MINITQKESDAVEIAGFKSITELMSKYFSLLNQKRDLESKIGKLAAEAQAPKRLVNAVGSNKPQINSSKWGPC